MRFHLGNLENIPNISCICCSFSMPISRNRLPSPTVPPSTLFKDVVLSSLIVAIVGYCVSLSMAKLFANKFHYTMDGNQEMFSEVCDWFPFCLCDCLFQVVSPSQGISNIIGSFFQCVPSAASMARSLVQVNVGGRTQLTSIVSASILMLVLLFIGPLFEPLPKVRSRIVC